MFRLNDACAAQTWNGSAWVSISPPGGFTEGSVIFASTTGTLTEDNSNFFWDNTNNFLGVGTNVPLVTVDIRGDFFAGVPGFASIDFSSPDARFSVSGNGVDTISLSAFTPSIYVFKTTGPTAWGVDGNVNTMTLFNATGIDAVILRAIAGTETVFNENGEDIDFRVEGDTDRNTLQVDASTDRVGIGIALPTAKLHVAGVARISGTTSAFESATGASAAVSAASEGRIRYNATAAIQHWQASENASVYGDVFNENNPDWMTTFALG